jgi:hypothetical protein
MTDTTKSTYVSEGEAFDEHVTERDAGPVDDTEAQAAADGLTVSDEVAAAYKSELERGAAQEGEGKFA